MIKAAFDSIIRNIVQLENIDVFYLNINYNCCLATCPWTQLLVASMSSILNLENINKNQAGNFKKLVFDNHNKVTHILSN